MVYLTDIIARKKELLERSQLAQQLPDMKRQVVDMPFTLDFKAAIRAKNAKPRLIAEVKKASPSKGIIRPDFNPIAIAEAYETAGAAAISVLTEEEFFLGANEYLKQIRQSVVLPLLRKDFIVDECQIYESRLIGSDAVLLITAVLEKNQLAEYILIARSLGLAALVEVHDADELNMAIAVNADIIGINNRNLRTFETDLSVTFTLSDKIPEGIVKVSESGISGQEEVNALAEQGIDAVLVGETFMRKDDVGAAVALLMEGK